MKKDKLLWIVGGGNDIRSSNRLGQLGVKLREKFKVRRLSLCEIRFFGNLLTGSPDAYKYIIISVDLRKLVHAVERISILYRHTAVWIYHEDPQDLFADSSEFIEVHKKINEAFRVNGSAFCGFLVPSEWWADYLRARGFSAKSFQIGTPPHRDYWDSVISVVDIHGSHGG